VYTTPDYDITYSFHDRRATANTGLQTARSTGHASVEWVMGRFSPQTLCWEIKDESRSWNKWHIYLSMYRFTYFIHLADENKTLLGISKLGECHWFW